MELNIFSTSNKSLCKVSMQSSDTVGDVKKAISRAIKKLSIHRQSIRSELKGKDLKDNTSLSGLGLSNGSTLYVKDLGLQIGWRTVFVAEYFGPLIVYILFALRPAFIYANSNAPYSLGAKIAVCCWSFHYLKRIYESIFVHRFSHATMPIRSLFKNCAYYWGFAAYIAVHVNHPLFTEPSFLQMAFGLGMFIFCELGNLSIHLLLRDLRPAGSTVRKIPKPNSNFFTKLFNLVSCPNYTYEYGAWLGFSILTSCVPALIFAMAGMYQMTLWAINKHKNYKKEFKDYPKSRKAIIPYML
ncbi:probable very-long-chain enoyl-CoA reductase art-1 [Onthophagus taurus]|uniref:probable very-long-chain enoyl-CoA reductase art-1 n=1 Tax=Onthophagus taurus TaxID=166361 RepID=UPI000C20012B|nr:probable very-long-chain enoyl-CoA reductase art-1 [Onthophagus taurus]